MSDHPHRTATRVAAYVKTLAVAVTCGALSFLAFQIPDATVVAESSTLVERAASDVERLVERHGCWTGDAPADLRGVVPGHVVVTLDGETHPRYAGAVRTGQALEQLPASLGGPGLDHGLRVHAFCR